MTRGEARGLFLVMLLALAAGGSWLFGGWALLALGGLLLLVLSFANVEPWQPPDREG